MARHLRQLIQEKDGEPVQTGTKKRDNGPPVWFLVSKEGVGEGGRGEKRKTVESLSSDMERERRGLPIGTLCKF